MPSANARHTPESSSRLIAAPRQNLVHPLPLSLGGDGADPDEQVVEDHRLGAEQDELAAVLQLLAILSRKLRSSSSGASITL
jgi:hypothetical protein